VSRILLDQDIPRPFARLLDEHQVVHASHLDWAELSNGALIAEAEKAGFDILITGDKNLVYQQNLAGRRIAIVLLSTHHWQTLRKNGQRVIVAVNGIADGMFLEVDVGRQPKRRRPLSEGDL
jgi:predicted nuclease of predicted toxin-antitoxin system